MTHISLREEALSADTLVALRKALADDPALVEQTRLWAAVCDSTAEIVTRQLPPNEDLIAIALHEAGLLGDADAATRSHVRAVQKALEPVRRDHPSVNALLERIAADARAFEDVWREHRQTTEPRRLRLVNRTVFMWTAAATVVLLAVAALFLLRPSESLRIGVPVGTSQTVELADGSSVLLAGPAELSWKEGSPRRVVLTGRGFFDVATHSDPFDVTTEYAVTTVSGTEFGVESGSAGTHVTVVSGRVRVRSRRADTDVLLEAGEAARIGPTGSAPMLSPAGLDPLTWTGLFIFRDTPVDSVAMALELAFNVDIDVHVSLHNETLTGTFDRDQSIGDILGVVAAALGADLAQQGDEPVYSLYRRETASG